MLGKIHDEKKKNDYRVVNNTKKGHKDELPTGNVLKNIFKLLGYVKLGQ